LMAGMKPDTAVKSNTTPLIWASFNGNLAMVKNLAEAGANVNVVNADGFTPLHAAVESENPEVVRYLLQRGAKINTATVQDGTTPLHTACYKGNKEIAQILIVAGANIEAKTVHGATPLVTATFYGKKDIVECLKANGAKIDVESKEGEVLAKSAITANKTESYDELVKAGADVNMTDENGKTMIQAAVEKNDVKTVETLIKDGANVNVVCKYKESSNVTPLMTAVIDKNVAVIKPLLKANADLNVKEKNLGLTALQIAILQGNEDIAADLIFNGADINSLSNDGFTAADLALAKKDVSMLKKLVASGALFGKNTGAELVKFGCSMNYDSEKGLYKIDANDAITSVLELEQNQNDGYVKYMEKSYTFRKEQGFALNTHILKVYRLLYEMIK
ncbi:MAG: ankyrin repeat domain-containing protein, partial [bacterium]|nr:ankyrin repeat domain-containing protein [bacterium]